MTPEEQKLKGFIAVADATIKEIRLLKLMRDAKSYLGNYLRNLNPDIKHVSKQDQVKLITSAAIMAIVVEDTREDAYKRIVKQYPFPVEAAGFLTQKDVDIIFTECYNKVESLRP